MCPILESSVSWSIFFSRAIRFSWNWEQSRKHYPQIYFWLPKSSQKIHLRKLRRSGRPSLDRKCSTTKPQSECLIIHM